MARLFKKIRNFLKIFVLNPNSSSNILTHFQPLPDVVSTAKSSEAAAASAKKKSSLSGSSSSSSGSGSGSSSSGSGSSSSSSEDEASEAPAPKDLKADPKDPKQSPKRDHVEPAGRGDLNDSASSEQGKTAEGIKPGTTPEKVEPPEEPQGGEQPEEGGELGADRSPSASPDRLQPPPTPPSAKDINTTPEKKIEPPKTPVGAGSSDIDLFAKPKGILNFLIVSKETAPALASSLPYPDIS